MKIKKGMQEHIDNLNKALRRYDSITPGIFFKEVRNTDNDYTEGSLSFSDFQVIFRCHDGSGYSFMERPVLESSDDSPLGTVRATYEMLFKFNFSPITFSAYDIHNAINDQNFRTLCFHNIIDEESAEQATSEMLDFITKNEKEIARIARETDLQKLIYDNYIFDEKVFDKKFSEEDFKAELNDNVLLHEILMNIHIPIQDGMYKFITTGSYNKLTKEFDKAEKKNNLIVFEKRYEKYLYDHSFPNVNAQLSSKEKNSKKKKTATAIFNAFTLIVSFISGIFITETATSLSVDYFYPDALYLGTTASEFEINFIIFALILLITTLGYRLPILKDKINRIYKPKLDLPIIIISILVFMGSISYTVYNYSNHGIYVKNQILYMDNSPVSENGKVEFIFIEGYLYTELDDTQVYSDDIPDRDLLYVVDGDYEDYNYSVVFNESGYVTDEVIKELRNADCKITSYKTIEAYADAHGFEITE